ncbi:suppressor of fused domain protein [Listeria costaricensis]|uniref:suppressor of fused domain protein n=1 Tax=Listeria costaricensis TaxID=2026604 RepID=UPI000C069424|nr:suppressor of fused domain protein [Listeria costaricensis]
MDLETFKKKAAEDESWAPGWDEIDAAFAAVYGDQEPAHYGTMMPSRAMFGGDQYLDGYSIFSSEKGYKHLVTYGLTELYTNEHSLGGEHSFWGYEMTIKLPYESAKECMWAVDMLSNLARYTNESKRYLEAYQFIGGNGESIQIGEESKITALVTVPDTEIAARDTLYGKVEFIQLVGVTETEFQEVRRDPALISQLVENLRVDYPDLVTDMARTKDYL